jgi:hypothetical protein
MFILGTAAWAILFVLATWLVLRCLGNFLAWYADFLDRRAGIEPYSEYLERIQLPFQAITPKA